MKTEMMTAFGITLAGMALQTEAGLSRIERQFRELPMGARRLTGPLFWLHGDETKERLEMYVEKVAEGGNGMFVAESRPHNDWLGEGWYRDLEICLEAARKNNLQMIIFDDYWWPSQMMGGRVPPQYGSKVLEGSSIMVSGARTIAESGYGDDKLISVVAGRLVGNDAVDSASLVNLTDRIEEGVLKWNVPDGEWRIMKFTWRFKGKVGAQKRMISVDGADPECVQWFIDTVYQPHYDRFKKDFGKTIIGFFYDEPETQGDWGSDVPVLAAECKVDIDELMVAYKFKLAGESQKAARYSYLDLFAESWGRTMYAGISEWCHKHGVFSMGHFMEHGDCVFRRDMSGGNMMQLQKYSDMGGIDLVCCQLYPGQRRMGEYQMPKIASSISHTYNKKDDIAFCEIFGAYGQNLTYPQMKWLADWHHVRGVSLLNPHSFNPRAPYDGDCPPYFYNGGFEPRWPLYRVWADYSSRLSAMLTGGRHICPVAFLHIGQSIHAGRAVRPEEFTSTLQDALLDSDWLLYDAWENDSRLDGDKIRLYDEAYSVLVVPPAEVIPYPVLAKAREFFEQGGIVVGYDFLPSKSGTPGKTSDDILELRDAIWGDSQPGLKLCKSSPAGGRSYLLPAKPNVGDVQRVLIEDAGVRPTLQVVEGDTANWLHVLHRVKEGSDIFLVCNQNHDGPVRDFKLRITAEGVPECWDAMRNEISSIAYTRINDERVELELSLEPSESLLLVFRKNTDGLLGLLRKARDLPRRLERDAKPVCAPIDLVRDSTPSGLVIPNEPSKAPANTGKDRVLKDCNWVWYPEGDPKGSAEPGNAYFRGIWDLPSDRKIESVCFIGSCDNAFTLYLNGREVGKSARNDDSWQTPTIIDLTKVLKTGPNLFAVSAVNMADNNNPAGLIGAWEVVFEDGERMTACIDSSWKASKKVADGWKRPDFNEQDWVDVMVLGKYGCEPWGAFAGQNCHRAFNLSPVKSDPFAGHFVLPSNFDHDGGRVYLVMEDIEPEGAARVTVNGDDVGGFIGKPYRLEISQQIKKGRNDVVIEPFAPKKVQVKIYERTE